MILNDNEINTRLKSPLNLINKINNVSRAKATGMELFIPRSTSNENESSLNGAVIKDELDQVIDEGKIKLGLVKAKALEVLHDSLNQLQVRLPEVSKVRDYSSIARDMKAILVDEEANSKFGAQVVIYKPVINDINKYETLVVME